MELQEKLENISKYLTQQSIEICRYNKCDEEHNCKLTAFIQLILNNDLKIIDIHLLDICISDYFQGVSENEIFSVIYLPFNGNSDDLLSELQIDIDCMFMPSKEEE